MTKSNKKSATKVEAAPAVAPTAKSGKKGKRQAEDEVEKQVSAKKQKIEEVAAKQKKEVKKVKKESSSDDSSSESEDEKPAPKVAVSSKKAPAKNGSLSTPAKKAKPAPSSSSEESSDEDSSDEDKVSAKKPNKVETAAKNKKDTKVQPKKKESSSDSDDSSSESDDEKPAAKVAVPIKKAPVKNGAVTTAAKKPTPSSSSEESSDDDSSDEEPKKVAVKPTPVQKKKEESSSDDSSSESEDEKPSVKAPAKAVPAAAKNRSALTKKNQPSESSDSNSSDSDSSSDEDDDNMSESCGSNAFPNAEGDKQKSKKRRTRPGDEEGGALSTTQKINLNIFEKINIGKDVPGSSENKGTQELDFEQMRPPDGSYTQEAVPESQVPETQLPLDLFVEANVQSPFEGRNVHATAEDNGPQVVDPDSKRFIDIYANDDNLNRPIVENIVRAALRKSDKINQRECTIMEGSYLAKKVMKYSKVKVDGKEVMNVMNLLQIKFKEYCRIMSQGVAGLEFNFDSGAIKLAEKGDQDVSMIRHMSTMHKHAILYFVSLKVIFRGTWEKYKESFLRRQKSNSSRRLYSEGGSSSSSGKRMSTSDTSKSIRKPPKLSVSSIFTAYEERPQHLAPLTRRLETIFSENKLGRMDVINKLLMFFSENPFLFNQFMSYDDDEFREKIILLKKTNLDKS